MGGSSSKSGWQASQGRQLWTSTRLRGIALMKLETERLVLLAGFSGQSIFAIQVAWLSSLLLLCFLFVYCIES